MGNVDMEPMNGIELGKLPESYYVEWEDSVRATLSNIEHLTQEIFTTGNSDTVLEMVGKYRDWDDLLTRYRNYLDDRSNYCEVLSNGFHLYDPVEFLELGRGKRFKVPDVKHRSSFSGVEIRGMNNVIHGYGMDEGREKFYSHGVSDSLSSIERCISYLETHEKEKGIPLEERLFSKKHVVMIHELNDDSKTRGGFLLSPPTDRLQAQINFDRELVANGFVYRWSVISLMNE